MINKRKAQSAERKGEVKSVKLLALSFSFALCVLNFSLSFAEEITILYTGDTHAMLYPCDCPHERNGGLARRSTLVKQIRKQAPDALLLDSGSFFAGGPQDEYAQNSRLDKERTLANIRAMQLMGYTAACIGEDEFGFGKEFFTKFSDENKFPLVSCNVKLDKIHPFIIKQVGSVKVGIIGISAPRIARRVSGVSVSAPQEALRDTIKQLKDNQVGVIILLSRLDPGEDLELVKKVPGVDLLITRYNRMEKDLTAEESSTIILQPSWQARSLGKVTLEIEAGRITDVKSEDIELTKKFRDDPEIKSVLPQCFRDNDCKKKGSIASCGNPGTSDAKCEFTPAGEVKLWVIEPKRRELFNAAGSITYLEETFPGVTTSKLVYPQRQARKIVAELDIQTLPAFIFEKEIVEEPNFGALREKFVEGDEFLILKPEFSGVSYYINRKKISGGLDLFISLYNKYSSSILEATRSFDPQIHFLATELEGKFDSAGGTGEIEEYLRSLCVKAWCPNDFWDYIICRAKNINSSWWEECLSGECDVSRVRDCARSQEGRDLLSENIRLNSELQVMFGPTFLIDNQQIFSTSGPGSQEEFKKIFRR